MALIAAAACRLVSTIAGMALWYCASIGIVSGSSSSLPEFMWFCFPLPCAVDGGGAVRWRSEAWVRRLEVQLRDAVHIQPEGPFLRLSSPCKETPRIDDAFSVCDNVAVLAKIVGDAVVTLSCKRGARLAALRWLR